MSHSHTKSLPTYIPLSADDFNPEKQYSSVKRAPKDNCGPDSLSHILAQLMANDRSPKRLNKHHRTSSTKHMQRTTKKEALEENGEDHVFDLLSDPIDSHTALRYYKKSIKSKGHSQSVSIKKSSSFKDAAAGAYKDRAVRNLAAKLGELAMNRKKEALYHLKRFRRRLSERLSAEKRQKVLLGFAKNKEFFNECPSPTSPRLTPLPTDQIGPSANNENGRDRNDISIPDMRHISQIKHMDSSQSYSSSPSFENSPYDFNDEVMDAINPGSPETQTKLAKRVKQYAPPDTDTPTFKNNNHIDDSRRQRSRFATDSDSRIPTEESPRNKEQPVTQPVQNPSHGPLSSLQEITEHSTSKHEIRLSTGSGYNYDNKSIGDDVVMSTAKNFESKSSLGKHGSQDFDINSPARGSQVPKTTTFAILHFRSNSDMQKPNDTSPLGFGTTPMWKDNQASQRSTRFSRHGSGEASARCQDYESADRGFNKDASPIIRENNEEEDSSKDNIVVTTEQNEVNEKIANIFDPSRKQSDVFGKPKENMSTNASSIKDHASKIIDQTQLAKTMLFTNNSDSQTLMSPQVLMLDFGLSPILETESPEITSRHKDTGYTGVEEIPQPQITHQKIVNALLLEKTCSRVIRKAYRFGFEKIKTHGDHGGSVVVYADYDDNQDTGRYNLSVRGPTRFESAVSTFRSRGPRLPANTRSGTQTYANSEDEFDSEGTPHNRRAMPRSARTYERSSIETGGFYTQRNDRHEQDPYLAKLDYGNRQIDNAALETQTSRHTNEEHETPRISTFPSRTNRHAENTSELHRMEGRLEKSLEKKLEAKIEQNLDQQLRGRLESELIKLLQKGLSSLQQRESSSQERFSNTDSPKAAVDTIRMRPSVGFSAERGHVRNPTGMTSEICFEAESVVEYSANSIPDEYPSFNNESPPKSPPKSDSNLLTPNPSNKRFERAYHSQDRSNVREVYSGQRKQSASSKGSVTEENKTKETAETIKHTSVPRISVTEPLWQGTLKPQPVSSPSSSPNKRLTLNYLVFCKKIEKVYKARLRNGFTSLCLRSTSPVQRREVQLRSALKKCSLATVRAGFASLKACSNKKLTQQNGLRKAFSMLNQRRLRILSEAFFHTAGFGLLKREYHTNLSLMTLQIEDMRKDRLRSFFACLKDTHHLAVNKNIRRKAALKALFRESRFKNKMNLQYAFLMWRGTANNSSVSMMHGSEKQGYEQNKNKCLFTLLNNLFRAKRRAFKTAAFYKMRTRTSKVKDAAALFMVLNQKFWNRLRIGFESLSALTAPGKTVVYKEDARKRKIGKMVDILKSKLHRKFMKLILSAEPPKSARSTVSNAKSTQAELGNKKGFLRLCVIANDIRQKQLMHGFKMLELHNINKQNQKSLYVNLALKLTLLMNEKEREHKLSFFESILVTLEKDELQRRALERLCRKKHTNTLTMAFSRFKNEVINIKLNHSIVHLAIKDIILAIEKLNKLQRTRKAVFFRRLAMHQLEKQQQQMMKLQTMASDISHIGQKVSSQDSPKNKFSSFTSLDFAFPPVVSEETRQRTVKFVMVLENYLNNVNRSGFDALNRHRRIANMTESLQVFGKDILKKLLFKRKFLSFAQIKFTSEKRRQKTKKIRVNAFINILKSCEQGAQMSKKAYFEQWKQLVRLDNERNVQNQAVIEQSQMKRFFQVWRKNYKKSALGQESVDNTPILRLIEVLEAVQTTKLQKFYKLAFKRILKTPANSGTPSIAQGMSTTEVSESTSPTKKKSVKSLPKNPKIPMKNLTSEKNNTSAAKSPLRSQTSKVLGDKTPKKAAPKTARGDASPTSASKIARQGSLVSSQPSSKVSTPSRTVKSTKKEKL